MKALHRRVPAAGERVAEMRVAVTPEPSAIKQWADILRRATRENLLLRWRGVGPNRSGPSSCDRCIVNAFLPDSQGGTRSDRCRTRGSPVIE